MESKEKKTGEIRLLTKDDIEVKIKQVGKNGALALLYKTARVDRQILDDTYGPMNWQCSFSVVNDNLYCAISVWDDSKHLWVSKSDCGVESETEKEKGEASDAFKRAGFKWGIGVELYNAPFIWLNVLTQFDSNKNAYVLSDKFQRFEVKSITITPDREITAIEIVDSKTKETVFSLKDGKSESPKPEVSKAVNAEPMRDPSLENQCADMKAKLIDIESQLDPSEQSSLRQWFIDKSFAHKPFNDMTTVKDLTFAMRLYTNALAKAKSKKADKPQEPIADEAKPEPADEKNPLDPNDNLPF